MRGSRFVGAASIRKTKVLGSDSCRKYEQPAGISSVSNARTVRRRRNLSRAPMNQLSKDRGMVGARSRRQIVRPSMETFVCQNRKRQSFLRLGLNPEMIG